VPAVAITSFFESICLGANEIGQQIQLGYAIAEQLSGPQHPSVVIGSGARRDSGRGDFIRCGPSAVMLRTAQTNQDQEQKDREPRLT
jgi:hypothetical protein